MSREAYNPPTSSSTFQPGGTTIPFFSTSTSGAGGLAAANAADALTQYLCGDCNSKVQLKKGDPIRCKECGHRVLYKERTKRMVQFEAR